MQAGSDLLAAAPAYEKTNRAAGKDRDTPAWHDVIQAWLDAMRTPSLTINLAGNKDIEAASLQIVKAAFQPAPDGDPTALTRQLHDQSAILATFRDAVRTAKL